MKFKMDLIKARNTTVETKLYYTVSAFNIANEEVFFHNVNPRTLKSLIRDLKDNRYTKIFSFIQD
jgi:hypothetical protein